MGQNERSYEEDTAEKPKQAGAVLCCSEEVLPTVVQVRHSSGRFSLSVGRRWWEIYLWLLLAGESLPFFSIAYGSPGQQSNLLPLHPGALRFQLDDVTCVRAMETLGSQN